MSTELNDRQRKVCNLVLKGSTHKQAYIDAGYKARGHSAEAGVNKLLAKPHIKSYLESLREELRKTDIMSAEELNLWHSAVIRTPIGDINEESDMCQEVRVDDNGRTLKMVSKQSSATSLARNLGYEKATTLMFGELNSLVKWVRCGAPEGAPDEGGTDEGGTDEGAPDE